jgi:phosphoglycerate dehydrogenase-like enzyme/aspartate/methionine/tyrosine aminotransferase
LDHSYCKENEILVRTNGGWCSTEVAEYTIAAIGNIAGAQQLFHKDMKTGTWNRDAFSRHTIAGATLAIIGCGNIGAELRLIAEAMNMKVNVYDPNVSRLSFAEAVQNADYVSLNVPLVEDTRRMINEKTLPLFKKGAVIINTSRGGVVDEADVLKFLDNHHLAYYVTDVFEKEPIKGHSALLMHPKVFGTPHIAGKTQESENKAALQIIDMLNSLLSNQTMQPLDEMVSLKTMRDIFDRFGRDEGMINMAAGMVEFSPPQNLRDIAAQLVRQEDTGNLSLITRMHMYRERLGDKVYRQAIQFLQEHHFGFNPVPLESVLAISGVSGGVTSVFQMVQSQLPSRIIKIGLFIPFYTYHREIALGVFGAKVEFVYLRVQEDQSFDFEIIKEAIKDLDLLIFTNPGNPSTHMLTQYEVERFEALARQNPHCTLLCDEVYADMLVPETTFQSFQFPFPQNIVMLRGFSKSLAIGSWRLGYALSHPLTIEKIAVEHDRIFICCNWTQMAVGKYIMEQYDDYLDYIVKQRQTLHANATALTQAFEQISWSVVPRHGSMYLLVKHNCKNDIDAFTYMKDRKVLVVPGYMLSNDEGNTFHSGYVRLHYAMTTEKVLEACNRIFQ